MSYTALYRKFRPVSFEDVKGQDHIVTTLKNQLKAGRIGHAYLFCGTRGTGKTTVAKILARAVNCEHLKDGSPMIWDLYGHVHDTEEARFIYDIQKMGAGRKITLASGATEPMTCNMINCFCMYSDYRPLSLDAWIELHHNREER